MQINSQTLKHRILPETYYLAGDLEAQVDAFVGHYNHRRYHESLKNLPPADVYFGRGQTICCKEKGSTKKHLNDAACNMQKRLLNSLTISNDFIIAPAQWP